MKTSFWRRWLNTLRRGISARPVSRVRGQRKSLCLEALENRVTPSLSPQLIQDINPNTFSSNPSELVAIGSTAYFTANDGVHGIELWKSDGSEAGTMLVKDIFPGSDNSGITELTSVNGTLFFSATNGTDGFGIWKSDGTVAGTVLVNGDAGAPYNLTDVNGTLFFSAHEINTGYELWKSDGTSAGTVLVKDINPDYHSSHPRNLTNVNGTLFFSVWDYYGTITPGLWKSDGTAAGTVLVKELYQQYPGQDGLQPRDFTNVNGTLFFNGYDLETSWELWKSDGTAAGTVMVKDIYAGAGSGDPRELTDFNGTLFFRAYDYTGNTSYELWKSDGTAAGTVIVKDIVPGTGSGYPANLTNVNGTLFFTASDGTYWGLWKSDGTAGGTVLVENVNASNLTDVNGTLFFSSNADDGSYWQELWKSDGTEAGTVLVKDDFSISWSPGSLVDVNGTLLFAASDTLHGAEVWRSNGAAAGTTLVKDIHTHTLSGYPRYMTDVNGTLFFTADDGAHGTELWKSDGTAAGTSLVKDIYPGGNVGYYGGYYPHSSSPGNLTNVNGTLFFTATDGTNGWKLWKSDGTVAGTVLLSASAWYPNNLTALGDTLFFTADDGYSGTELWSSDGTTAGTTVVTDIYPGYHREYDNYGGWWYVPNSSSPGSLTNLNGTLFFSADSAHGRELWKSNGTALDTVLVADIHPGSAFSNPSNLRNLNDTLFFSANDGAAGYELWKSNGTSVGTTLVKDIRPGATGSYPSALTNVNGTLFFAAGDGTTGSEELWKSDGTSAGTALVKDINPGSGGAGARYLTNVNGTLFLTAYDGTNGGELWKSDGTAAGTVLVKDINPGSGHSIANNLTHVNGRLFFTAYSASVPELWQSDGTDAGTVLVTNLYYPSWLANFNNTLVFSASDGTHGFELWNLVDDGSSMDVGGFPTTITAGVAGSFTVTVTNEDGSINTDYRGTAHFTSSDPQAALPADYTFTAADQGVHTFTATLKTAGGQSITARDTAAPNLSDTQSGITVNPAAASRFTVAGFPSPVTAGVAGSFAVTARDPFGNRVTGYTGTVRFTSSDSQAVLPGNYTFTAGDAGIRSFNATLKTAGSRSLTATDIANGTVNGTQTSIQVNAAAVRQFRLDAPASVLANASFNLTVTVLDAYGNVVTGYRGRIRFSSSDSTAKLPKNYTFTAADQGVHTFTGLVLRRRGVRSITVTDTLDSSIIGSVWIDVR